MNLLRPEAGLVILLLPVTHRPPAVRDDAVETPMAIEKRLGLDDEQSWIVLTEWNEAMWPGPDLRPTSRRKAASIAHGFLPPRFFDHVRLRFIEMVSARRARRVKRSE